MHGNLIIKITPGKGLGVFAKTVIKQGEKLANFDGSFHEAESASQLPNKFIADHVVQCAPHLYRESTGIAELLNHSCEPNCGIQNLFTIVTMRDIQAGEELTWDYDMTENSDWQMQCLCGTPSCRKTIGRFARLPDHKRQEYGSYISAWLR